jgi:hypothetical protein
MKSRKVLNAVVILGGALLAHLEGRPSPVGNTWYDAVAVIHTASTCGLCSPVDCPDEEYLLDACNYVCSPGEYSVYSYCGVGGPESCQGPNYYGRCTTAF